jgi:hypothetical protein
MSDPGHENGRKRIDLDSELGMSRRDLLRRSALVGGALLWVAPAIQSITPAASAQETNGPTPATCAACYCWNGDKQNPTGSPRRPQDECSDDGPVGQRASALACDDWCKGVGTFAGAGAPGGPYAVSDYCSGTDSCVCNSENDPGTNGVFCT